MTNFNNPEKLNKSMGYSVISTELANPFIQYANFGDSDPVLNSTLPQIINLGITSPGFLDNASECSGLDFMNTNPQYPKLTFQQCLNKFEDKYSIPELAFENLLNNLPMTFSALPVKEKNEYVKKLKDFIHKLEEQKNKDNKNKDNKNKEQVVKVNNTEQFNENKKSSSEEENDKTACNILNIVAWIIIIIGILLSLYLIFKK
jgi:ABC-type antimicrobial peptide transport system permease subunit